MKKVAVYTSGGDAPGMNACIRAVVRGAIYHGAEIFGIRYGYNGMIKGDIKQLNSYSVSNIIQKGGTILKSARSEDFKTKEGRKKAFDFLRRLALRDLFALEVMGPLPEQRYSTRSLEWPSLGPREPLITTFTVRTLL